MNNLFLQCTYFGAVLTIAAYLFGQWCKRKWKLPICNPLLIAVIVVIALLLGFHVQYDTYYEGAKYISYLLTPATVCLAIPLYRQLELLKQHATAILLGVCSGVVASMGGIFVIAALFHLSHEEYVTFLPKSITTAIGMGVSEELGGIVTITVAIIILTGASSAMSLPRRCARYFVLRSRLQRVLRLVPQRMRLVLHVRWKWDRLRAQ